MRGQVGLGIFKFLIGSWATLGIWPLVDFIIALVKLGNCQGDPSSTTRASGRSLQLTEHSHALCLGRTTG